MGIHIYGLGWVAQGQSNMWRGLVGVLKQNNPTLLSPILMDPEVVFVYIIIAHRARPDFSTITLTFAFLSLGLGYHAYVVSEHWLKLQLLRHVMRFITELFMAA